MPEPIKPQPTTPTRSSVLINCLPLPLVGAGVRRHHLRYRSPVQHSVHQVRAGLAEGRFEAVRPAPRRTRPWSPRHPCPARSRRSRDPGATSRGEISQQARKPLPRRVRARSSRSHKTRCRGGWSSRPDPREPGSAESLDRGHRAPVGLKGYHRPVGARDCRPGLASGSPDRLCAREPQPVVPRRSHGRSEELDGTGDALVGDYCPFWQ